jgi:hypothetical protein
MLVTSADPEVSLACTSDWENAAEKSVVSPGEPTFHPFTLEENVGFGRRFAASAEPRARRATIGRIFFTVPPV